MCAWRTATEEQFVSATFMSSPSGLMRELQYSTTMNNFSCCNGTVKHESINHESVKGTKVGYNYISTQSIQDINSYQHKRHILNVFFSTSNEII